MNEMTMKKNVFLWMCALVLLLTAGVCGCSSDDDEAEDNGDFPSSTNVLQISREGGATETYSVTNNKFYIDRMPMIDVGPGFIFYCHIEESVELERFAIYFRGVKYATDDFKVGETFKAEQLCASLIPKIWDRAKPSYDKITKGSVKLVKKKKRGAIDVLTFQIRNLCFDDLYTLNGTVDYEYEGTVY